MGSAKDVMELFAEMDIRHLFSDYNRWTVTPVSGPRPTVCFYRASKRNWVGEEIALIAVSFVPLPAVTTINAE